MNKVDNNVDLSNLDSFSVEEMRKTVSRVDEQIGTMKGGIANAKQMAEEGIEELDKEWLRRVSYRLNVFEKKRSILINRIRIESGMDLISHFFDIAKVMMSEDQFNAILKKAKEMQALKNNLNNKRPYEIKE